MSTKTRVWTVDHFRKELKKLDDMVYEKQGIKLEGATFDIKLTERTYQLATCWALKGEFTFSKKWFNKSTFPESCAINVIRHEYAHYYAYSVFGYQGGHGKPWKQACIILGANPTRCHSNEYEEYERYFEQEQKKSFISFYDVGDSVVHPQYGEGKILNIKESRNTAILEIEFPEKGVVKIDETWLVNMLKSMRDKQ